MEAYPKSSAGASEMNHDEKYSHLIAVKTALRRILVRAWDAPTETSQQEIVDAAMEALTVLDTPCPAERVCDLGYRLNPMPGWRNLYQICPGCQCQR